MPEIGSHRRPRADPPPVALTARASRPQAPRPAPRAATRRSDSPFAPLIYGGLGFVTGAVFWHMIGFWGFVEQALRGPDGPRVRVEQVQLPAPAASPAVVAQPAWRLRAAPLAVADCSMFAKPREGAAPAMPCPINAAALPEGGNGERGDPLAAGRPASATVRRAPQPSPPSATWMLSVTNAGPAPR